ncbi:MAG: flavodoxin II [Cellvibrionaceae bacterium]|jgi:flavodoxin II
MKRAPIGLFYGSSTCYTEMSAEKIQQCFGQENIDLFNIADTAVDEIDHYQQIIFGIPTWDYGELQEDWEAIWDEIDNLKFADKTVAIFGLGDQIGYPDWFLDAMGFLHNKILLLGATVIGYWPNDGYTFETSQALNEEKTQFLGLALDDENQFDKTDERITLWCEQLKLTFQL